MRCCYNRIVFVVGLALWSGWPLAASACGFNSVGDFICEKSGAKAPSRPAKPAHPLKRNYTPSLTAGGSPLYVIPQVQGTGFGQATPSIHDLATRLNESLKLAKLQLAATAAAHPQSQSPAAGPVCTGDTIFALNYDDGKMLPPNLQYQQLNNNASIENGMMKVSYDAGVVGPQGGAQWKNSIGSHDEALNSFTVCFPSNFDPVLGGKLPGFCGGNCPSGGADASKGFSSRYMWGKGNKLVLYLYHLHQPGTWGQSFTVGTLQPGSCVNLAQRVKLNDVGRKNGEIQVWVNGKEALNLQNMEFRRSDWHINSFIFSTFYGGNTQNYAPYKQETVYFDNIQACKPSSTITSAAQ